MIDLLKTVGLEKSVHSSFFSVQSIRSFIPFLSDYFAILFPIIPSLPLSFIFILHLYLHLWFPCQSNWLLWWILSKIVHFRRRKSRRWRCIPFLYISSLEHNSFFRFYLSAKKIFLLFLLPDLKFSPVSYYPRPE